MVFYTKQRIVHTDNPSKNNTHSKLDFPYLARLFLPTQYSTSNIIYVMYVSMLVVHFLSSRIRMEVPLPGQSVIFVLFIETTKIPGSVPSAQ